MKPTKKTLAARSQKWRRENPERYREIESSSRLKRRYGITLSDKKAMIVSQNNLCGLCAKRLPDPVSDCAVDHDHKTKQVRGVVHRGCNVALARLGDDKTALNRLFQYFFPARPLEHQNYFIP